MKVLIAEDDFASRKFMLRFFEKYGECDVTVDGKEAVEAYIRKIEEESGVAEDKRVKIVMTTALSETRHVTKAFENGCTAYAGKPINQDKLEAMLKKFKLIEE